MALFLSPGDPWPSQHPGLLHLPVGPQQVPGPSVSSRVARQTGRRSGEQGHRDFARRRLVPDHSRWVSAHEQELGVRSWLPPTPGESGPAGSPRAWLPDIWIVPWAARPQPSGLCARGAGC